jgi:hypothetical protein
MIAALALAACGGSSSDAGTTGSEPGGSNPALEFAQCMRSNGVPNFPDPGQHGIISVPIGAAQSPAFQSAQKACAKYSPKQGAPLHMTASQQRAALRFAQCMRRNGLPGFPDPESGSGSPGSGPVLVLRGLLFSMAGSDINPRSPAFMHTAQACGIKLPSR